MAKNIFTDLRRKQLHQFREPSRSDPYRSDKKLEGNPTCQKCGAIQFRGKWVEPSKRVDGKTVSMLTRAKRKTVLCSTCRKINDRYALGVVELRGQGWKSYSKQIFETIRKTEEIAKNRNNQERIIRVGHFKTLVKVYTALPELARHIGRELEKTFKGRTEYLSTKAEPYLRVRWWSDGSREKSAKSEKKVIPKSKSFRRRGQIASKGTSLA